METFLIALASFAGGGFLTALGFIFGWSNKITTLVDGQKSLGRSIDELRDQLKAHIAEPEKTCPMHTGILIDIDRLKTKAGIP